MLSLMLNMPVLLAFISVGVPSGTVRSSAQSAIEARGGAAAQRPGAATCKSDADRIALERSANRIRRQPTPSRLVWRRDGGAFAVLRSAVLGSEAVVFFCDTRQPLIQPLASVAAGNAELFWIGTDRLGVGSSEIVPRVVISWSRTAR